MNHNTNIVEKLSQFNNLSFTKKQWDVILNGCSCPKSSHFWYALRKNNLIKESKIYTLIGIDIESFNKVWEDYCKTNKSNVTKHYNKVKARKQAQERRNSFKSFTLYMVNGVLTTELPEKD